MAKAKVYNRHSLGMNHREMFKGTQIDIPAGQFVEMDYEEAVEFRGQYFPMKFGADEIQLPESYKMIEIVPGGTAIDANVEPSKSFVCQMDGKSFPTQAALDEYIKTNYSGQQVKDETLDKEIENAKKVRGKVA